MEEPFPGFLECNREAYQEFTPIDSDTPENQQAINIIYVYNSYQIVVER